MDIDRELAEEIMGWKLCSCMKGFIPHCDGYHDWTWYPSKDISQAFKVVEQLKKSGWQMHLFSLIKDTRVVFYKSFRDWHELKERDYSVSNSPSMAICLAALKTIGK